MAAKWEGFQRNKERYPNLQYLTAGDEHVRDDHAKLHGFTAHIDDPIWDRIYPPNGWRCRCYVVQTDLEASDIIPDVSVVEPEFSVNVGKTGSVFNEEAHPYYIMPAKDEERLKLAFESMKLRLSYGKARFAAANGSKVYVHPFVDANARELIPNYKVAVKLTEELNRDVKLRPHIDGTVLLKHKNAEYLIGKKLADRKAPLSLNFRNVFNKAVKQQCKIVVIDLINNSNSIKVVKERLEKTLSKPTNYSSIKEVIIISKDRKVIERITRK